MRILHIIGNGFDLNLGLKTSYRDFFDYYQSLESSDSSINKLKRTIGSDFNSWSDLELALGQYTTQINSLDDFDIVFEDIGEKLAEYLVLEEGKFDAKTINRDFFLKNLVKPEDFLPVADRNKILAYKNVFSSGNWLVDIVTFNYTRTIEKIIGNLANIKIDHHIRSDLKVALKSIEHIHGYVDDRMVLGVNDISQLKNGEFHQNQDILEAIVKNECNKAYKHNVNDTFKKKIQQADLICMFGTSIGDSDNMWWEQLGEKLKSKDTPLIIFTKGEEVISPRIGYKNSRTERKIRDYFLNKTKLGEEEKEKLKANIFVALNTQIFKNIS